MSEFSPAAQAVLDAVGDCYKEDIPEDRDIIIAALRAAANQLKYKLLNVEVVDCSQLRLLADELEAQ
jgi:hypothetical protein